MVGRETGSYLKAIRFSMKDLFFGPDFGLFDIGLAENGNGKLKVITRTSDFKLYEITPPLLALYIATYALRSFNIVSVR